MTNTNTLDDLVNCIAEASGIETDTNGIVAAFDINTEPSADLSNNGRNLASFVIHNEGTGDLTELNATEKIAKLKQQWMEITQKRI